MKDWIDNEKRVNGIVTTNRSMENDSQNLMSKMPVLCIDMINFCRKYRDELAKEVELNHPMLKEKHQDNRKDTLTKLKLEFEERFRKSRQSWVY